MTNGLTSRATGAHFTLPGHTLADNKISIVEQTLRKNSEYRIEREQYLKRIFDTIYNGLNRQK